MLRQAIRSASPEWLAASLGIAIATFVLRAFRWTWLLRPVGRVPFLPAFLATAVGFAANNLPARVGEVIRPALLARMRRLPFSALLASILFERALDGGSVVFFFLLLALLLGLPGATAGGGAFATLRDGRARRGGRSSPCSSERRPAPLSPRGGGPVLRPAGRPAARVAWQPRARAAAAAFPAGFASLSEPAAPRDGRRPPRSLMWLVINVQIYAVMRAFHIALPFSSSFVVTAAAVLGLAVPTPGGIGSYQAAVQYALTRFYGVPLAPASGVALMAWAVSFVPITAIGLAALASKTVRAALSDAREDGR